MSRTNATLRSSGSIDDPSVRENVSPPIGIRDCIALDQIHLPAEHLLKLVLHVQNIEQTPRRLGIERHENVHVAVFPELLRAHHRPKERELDDPPFSSE